ncbi:hypothetical protein GCM10011344_46380 [Dokdonia pacifica]|uniref:Uncharacterized protein n=1 Tax=Dokdonia pacifica TaxID=1627892 RepID=A0A239D9U6_9FLAO|nr:hypothetical protein [Dokdonia pacifica]GGG40241.1 hypothetical protein GCM10011344_46380 [Dokdonia pacifica]SNS29125.1 hypothetical protein SAMN06265376_11064 [Dokdonia pacifica]
MIKLYRLAFVAVFMFTMSCSEDDKAIDTVVEQIERGAILRNIDRVSPNFERTELQSAFTVVLEEQDLEEGGIFDFVRLYLQYLDRTPSNGNNSQAEIVLKDVPSSDFQPGGNGLPVGTIEVIYQDAIDAFNLDSNSILAGDQFELRAEIHLTDGRTFSTENGSSSILTDACFFKSPYRYVINVIDTIDNDLYTGTYSYEIISGPNGSFFNLGEQGIVSITAGNTPNVRNTGLIAEGLEFTIAGTNVYPKIYQSVNLFCRDSAFNALTGPDEENFGIVDLADDTVFELDLVFAYEGWGGSGDLTTPQSYRFRFSKQ